MKTFTTKEEATADAFLELGGGVDGENFEVFANADGSFSWTEEVEGPFDDFNWVGSRHHY